MSAVDVRELDAQAVRASVAAVARVGPDDLERPTPCAGWTVADLLGHMTAQHNGFAAAAHGRGAEPDVWQVPVMPGASSSDLVAAYADAADRVLAAFGPDDVLDRRFALPEVTTQATFRGARAIGFHFIDYVVHGWDVARALGLGFDLPADVLDAALAEALAIPDGPERARPGAAFRPGVEVPDGASTMDRIVATLGRSPTWPT